MEKIVLDRTLPYTAAGYTWTWSKAIKQWFDDGPVGIRTQWLNEDTFLMLHPVPVGTEERAIPIDWKEVEEITNSQMASEGFNNEHTINNCKTEQEAPKTMSFGEALVHLEKGEMIWRLAWKKIFLHKDVEFTVSKEAIFAKDWVAGTKRNWGQK